MKKIKSIIKNKRAQAAVEFCLAIPVVLMMTLGVIDVAKANIIKLENMQAMQMYLSKASADGGDTSPSTIIGFAGEYIQQTSMFCTKVQGAKSQSPCAHAAGVEPVMTTLRLEKATRSATMNAGTQICMASKSEYKPYYSGIYSGGKMTVYSRACTLMETTKQNAAGWQPMALGAW